VLLCIGVLISSVTHSHMLLYFTVTVAVFTTAHPGPILAASLLGWVQLQHSCLRTLPLTIFQILLVLLLVSCSGSQLEPSPVSRAGVTTGPTTTHAWHSRSSGAPDAV
jgi:hypothetical protein